ncbi:hypothetical protein BD779DRAFT_1402893, partial [Infundibulicybe gibba]
LRQEFRDLEVLDEISRLTYDGCLPQAVQGDRRNVLIASYRTLKGESYVPPTVHNAIRWSKTDPYTLTNIDYTIESAIPKTQDKVTELAKLGISRPAGQNEMVNDLPRPSKRNISTSAAQGVEVTKRTKSVRDIDSSRRGDRLPIRGTQWRDNSCAYDAVVTIFYNVWNDDSESWTEWFNSINKDCLGALADG